MSMQKVNLADLAAQDITNVKEVRMGELVAEGIFVWEIGETGLEDDETEDGGVTYQRLRAIIPLKIVDVKELKTAMSDEDREKLVGFEHKHKISGILKKDDDIEVFTGRVKAFLVDAGIGGTGQLGVLMQSANGKRFMAPINHTTDRNDKSRKYANLDMRKAQAMAS